MTRRILEYIRHLFHRRHRRGHGIHSPYVFEFVNKVLFNGAKYVVADGLTAKHRELKSDLRKIPVTDIGAGSTADKSRERTVASFVRHSSLSEKYGGLLYRIAHWFKPDMMLELGTGLGISTLYLASGSSGTPLHSIEGNKYRVVFARELMDDFDLQSVHIHTGDMSECLDAIIPSISGKLLAFVDGNHRYEPTMVYMKKLLGACEGEALIIMDDIYWSKEMTRAWKELLLWPEVRISIDLYYMGILMLRKDLHKAHYKIKF